MTNSRSLQSHKTAEVKMHISHRTTGEFIIGGLVFLMVLEHSSAYDCKVTPYTFEAYNYGGHCRQNITIDICYGWCLSSEVNPGLSTCLSTLGRRLIDKNK